jgi:hypothetical protein
MESLGKNQTLVIYSKKLSYVKEYQIFFQLVFTSFVDIGIDDILELDKWNHVDALDAKEIMHQTWLDVIKFNRPRGFKQN